MRRSDILLAFVATGALVGGPALAKQSRNETAPMHMNSSALMEAREKLNAELEIGASSATGGSVSKKQSPESSENSSRSFGEQQKVMRGHFMKCSRYIAMNAAGQTETVDSMRSKMPAANMMASSHEMAKKVVTSCKDHGGMMVHEVMENVMPQSSVTP